MTWNFKLDPDINRILCEGMKRVGEHMNTIITSMGVPKAVFEGKETTMTEKDRVKSMVTVLDDFIANAGKMHPAQESRIKTVREFLEGKAAEQEESALHAVYWVEGRMWYVNEMGQDGYPIFTRCREDAWLTKLQDDLLGYVKERKGVDGMTLVSVKVGDEPPEAAVKAGDVIENAGTVTQNTSSDHNFVKIDLEKIDPKEETKWVLKDLNDNTYVSHCKWVKVLDNATLFDSKEDIDKERAARSYNIREEYLEVIVKDGKVSLKPVCGLKEIPNTRAVHSYLIERGSCYAVNDGKMWTPDHERGKQFTTFKEAEDFFKDKAWLHTESECWKSGPIIVRRVVTIRTKDGLEKKETQIYRDLVQPVMSGKVTTVQHERGFGIQIGPAAYVTRVPGDEGWGDRFGWDLLQIGLHSPRRFTRQEAEKWLVKFKNGNNNLKGLVVYNEKFLGVVEISEDHKTVTPVKDYVIWTWNQPHSRKLYWDGVQFAMIPAAEAKRFSTQDQADNLIAGMAWEKVKVEAVEPKPEAVEPAKKYVILLEPDRWVHCDIHWLWTRSSLFGTYPVKKYDTREQAEEKLMEMKLRDCLPLYQSTAKVEEVKE